MDSTSYGSLPLLNSLQIASFEQSLLNTIKDWIQRSWCIKLTINKQDFVELSMATIERNLCCASIWWAIRHCAQSYRCCYLFYIQNYICKTDLKTCNFNHNSKIQYFPFDCLLYSVNAIHTSKSADESVEVSNCLTIDTGLNEINIGKSFIAR